MTEEDHSPVEDFGSDTLIEAVQGDVVLHERLHLDHVGNVQGVFQTLAASCDRESDDAAAGAELKSGGPVTSAICLPRAPQLTIANANNSGV